MNDINKMPPKCQYCPYWEVCKYPWVCPDIGDNKPDLQPTCNKLATDAISRSGVSAWLANMGYLKLADAVMDEDRFPSAQPERKRGKWTLIGMKMYKTVVRTPDQKEVLLEKEWRREKKIQCPCCGKLTMLDYSITYEICPHCGADMRG